MLHGHGDDSYRYDREIVADFSTNVWHEGPHTLLVNFLSEQVNKIGKYPEPVAESLTNALADFHNLLPENVLPTNGATEAFYLLGHWNKHKTATIFYPTFAEYEDACQLFENKLNFLPYSSLDESILLPKGMAFICNPNNPDGKAISLERIEKILKTNQDSVLIIDEAYIDFAPRVKSAVELLGAFENLAVVKSLTKTFAMPGLRLGYVLANEKIIKALTQLKMPWSVNALAVEAGKFIIENYEKLLPDMNAFIIQTNNFITQLEAIATLEITASHTHYFLVNNKFQKASTLKPRLIQEYGILIRNASNFRSLNEYHFRLATLSPSKNQLIVEALEKLSNV